MFSILYFDSEPIGGRHLMHNKYSKSGLGEPDRLLGLYDVFSILFFDSEPSTMPGSRPGRWGPRGRRLAGTSQCGWS
jgi:hypothetical protein